MQSTPATIDGKTSVIGFLNKLTDNATSVFQRKLELDQFTNELAMRQQSQLNNNNAQRSNFSRPQPILSDVGIGGFSLNNNMLLAVGLGVATVGGLILVLR